MKLLLIIFIQSRNKNAEMQKNAGANFSPLNSCGITKKIQKNNFLFFYLTIKNLPLQQKLTTNNYDINLFLGERQAASWYKLTRGLLYHLTKLLLPFLLWTLFYYYSIGFSLKFLFFYTHCSVQSSFYLRICLTSFWEREKLSDRKKSLFCCIQVK